MRSSGGSDSIEIQVHFPRFSVSKRLRFDELPGGFFFFEKTLTLCSKRNTGKRSVLRQRSLCSSCIDAGATTRDASMAAAAVKASLVVVSSGSLQGPSVSEPVRTQKQETVSRHKLYYMGVPVLDSTCLSGKGTDASTSQGSLLVPPCCTRERFSEKLRRQSTLPDTPYQSLLCMYSTSKATGEGGCLGTRPTVVKNTAVSGKRQCGGE